MAFQELDVLPGTPDELKHLVRNRIEPQLRDIHAMLRLPLDGVEGLEAGCNLSSALVLLATVDGVAQELYVDRRERDFKGPLEEKARFKEMLIEHFPWSEEPLTAESINKETAADILYDAYRNALVHNMGAIRSMGYDGAFKVAKGPLTEAEIEALETASSRPQKWVEPSLRHSRTPEGEKWVLTVKFFYWGVRRMVENVLADRVAFEQRQIALRPASQPAAVIFTTATAADDGLSTVTEVSSRSTESD